jgi:PAS domain S-box-containing protein
VELQRAEERRAAEAVAAAQRLAEREAELGTIIAGGAATRGVLEARLEEVQLALQHAEQAAETERLSAHAREQAIQNELAREADARTNAENDLREARAEFSRGRRRLLVAASALRRRTAERWAHREALVAEERSGAERRLAAREATIRQAETERDTLRQSLDAARGELRTLSDRYDTERSEFERVRSISESKLQELTAEYDLARHSLEHLRDAFNTLERVSSEHAIERTRLEGVVVDRDARISAQEAAHLAAERAAKDALRQVEDTLRQTVERKNSQVSGLERELEVFRRDLERSRSDGEALRREAEQLPMLRGQLDTSEQENWQQFANAPHAMCRLTRDGGLLAANQAFAKVLGYRSMDELGKPDLAAAVFDAPADLRWLIERATGGGAPATIETVWKKKDRTRLTVRLQVARTKEDWLEVGAEDITTLRTTEENLRQARRMEAVGRLASEVAVTCDTLLRGVSHGGQYWLAAIGSDLGLRRQGEQLLGDVAQATTLLQRLAAYGNEQIDALRPVNLQHVLHNLEPVLKRVAGDDIEVVLPKHVRPFSVDVERTRVERVLVNVASYARERMPHGGRLKVDLASAVVDRTFLDRYPNVRPGPHVIATVTEEPRTTRTGLAVAWPAPASEDSTTSTGEKPGVDLSALMRLVGDCGGHLWITAEPTGNMTVKIHLPLCASDDATSPAGWFARAGNGRALGRWSRH